MTQQQLFDDIEKAACPKCGGVVAVTDSIVNVAKCENCGLTVIKSRGRWQEFKSYFGGGKAAGKAPKKRTKRSERAA